MQQCVWYDHWPPREDATSSAAVRHIALPWDALAQHVSARDLDGKAFQTTLDRNHAKLEAVILPSLTSLSVEEFERETDDHYMRMQVAERVGAPLVILTSDHAGEIGFDATVDAVTRLAALAERMDVRILLRNRCDSALAQPEAFDALFRRVQSEALGVCLDIHAFDRARVNASDMVLRFADRLGAIWIPTADHDRLSDTTVNVLDEARDEAFDGWIISDAQSINALHQWSDH